MSNSKDARKTSQEEPTAPEGQPPAGEEAPLPAADETHRTADDLPKAERPQGQEAEQTAEEEEPVAEGPRAGEGEPSAGQEPRAEAEPAAADERLAPSDDQAPPDGQRDLHIIDVLVDELALARAQIDAGMPALAEGTLRRRIAWLEASGIGGGEETDAARALLAEALWRQGRILSARTALDGIRAGSPQRRLPIATIIEAEVLAAAGESDRAAGAVERVVDNVGVDETFALRAGTHGRATWPLPTELLPPPPRPGRPPWSSPYEAPEAPSDDARRAAARGRLEEARVAYVVGALERGDGEMSIAVRLDPSLAPDGVAIIEPTLGGQPSSDRLLLYGDLLRAAGRDAEADEAYDRAAERQG